MSRSSRRNKAEVRLVQLESEFVEKLTAALRDCAAGRWGLFGRNDHLLYLTSPAPELLALGDRIRSLRAELGFSEPFPLHERFLYYRAMRGANVPGEPKLAAALLGELEQWRGR